MYNLQTIKSYYKIMIISEIDKNIKDRIYNFADGVYRPGCEKCNKCIDI